MSAIEILSVQMQVGAWSIRETKVLETMDGCDSILPFAAIAELISSSCDDGFFFAVCKVWSKVDQVLELVRLCPATWLQEVRVTNLERSQEP